MTVLQIDREAAARLLGGATPDGLLDGRCDTLSLIQAFASHREQATRDLVDAAQAVLLWRVGEQPAKGWLRDNDCSRTALTNLMMALVNSRSALTKANHDA